MPTDKYSSLFSCQMVTIVYIFPKFQNYSCCEKDLRDSKHWVLTIYNEKPEIPGGKSNSKFHSVRNIPEKVGGRLSRSTFPALFGFPGWCVYHFSFPLFSRFFTQDKTKWRKTRETKVSLKTVQ